MAVEVVYWNPKRPVAPGLIGRVLPVRKPVNNFGDLLGPAIVKRILETRGIARPGTGRLLTVGSVVHLSRAGDVVWGSGINGKTSAVGGGERLDVRAVRGPLTRSRLEAAGASVPEIYGDPGLLLARLMPELGTGSSERPVTIVPNLHDWSSARRDPRALSPIGDFRKIVPAIAASKLVVGSSLHGVVVAEAFGVPARLVTSSTEPLFKYHDYYLGSGRPIDTPIASTNDEAVELGGAEPHQCDLDSLLDAFPLDMWAAAD
ncbi:pyruvyl transferase [Nocardioides ginsengisegetis]|uniref:Pyruvyl transferase n=1 Tax=Nocardioides ginsengisegetis TaxID=661491 RepID=A0A7W3IWC2_9ACTN|nr:polysaccharide pyruvyl transferase family protein [Nocardioides ginsengisegetis]MBA8801830.1 pyruvyl transferase [Nocardioides ginsengisegetis]